MLTFENGIVASYVFTQYGWGTADTRDYFAHTSAKERTIVRAERIWKPND